MARVISRVIYNSDRYLAAVDRAGYKKDVQIYERKLRIWNIIHRLLTVIAYVDGSILLFFFMALDDVEHEKLVFTGVAITGLILAITTLLLKIPKPKLPFGLKIHKGRYIIAGFTHPGEDIVEVNTDYVFADGRRCRVIPCNVKTRRSFFWSALEDFTYS